MSSKDLEEDLQGTLKVISEEAEGQTAPSWGQDPMRALIFSLYFINNNLGMLMRFNVII